MFNRDNKKSNMKKIIFLVFFMSFVVPSYCQQYGSFMGIKLGGDINTFIKQISSKGFEYDRQDAIHPEAHYLKGAYLGEYVELLVGITPQTHKVWVVEVMFSRYKIGEARDSDIKFYYNELKNKIKAKYGTPTHDDHPLGDLEGCWADWNNSIGSISLGYSKYIGSYLNISFTDSKTHNIYEKEKDSYL